jgi:membrane-associated phospholipid phosphatase
VALTSLPGQPDPETLHGPAAFHGWPLLAAPVVALIGWARVRLNDHTIAQVVAGAAFGAAIALVAMPPLTGW